ncbi:hypothetical protein TSTA_077200 [Talaromyces stipitatus ATCC 10500]|uniref:Uncharacterized protein n=1 Tax=Talaromyces stipitatus (strain ATCC 10500 / CBS 375.48 / QM 6759 / NRRL 1006) TaxID=441959 RepID=B8LVY7_TALSN|nr:uncharacterized protein TSTA_077200 [Talaromyces stipitatus ATCC 10500]EED24353.1 hypothetical protein TSTA_077200 [Talaromyces stipitatus ATCC 10500]
MDIASDAAEYKVIILSRNVIWRVKKISGAKKFALVAISLLTTAIIAVALTRMEVGLRSKKSYHDPAFSSF